MDRYHQSLALVVDMFGCPNRCRHCWLGHMPNKSMDDELDIWIVDYFKPFFHKITYYSWLREPDFCDHYRERWDRDNQISVHAKPERFELASFWRLVRDPDYVRFLKEVGVQKVQLTFFGLEQMTDKYVGRKGAFQELLRATEILISNQIAPRWQAFINEENKNEIVPLLDLADALKLKERCAAFGNSFQFFVHSGSCEGENRKLYGIRVEKAHIPEEIKPYYLDFEKILTERECCELLKDDAGHLAYHNNYEGSEIVLNISNALDVYFNFTHMTVEWRIGNMRTDAPEELVRRIAEQDTYALNLAGRTEIKDLVKKYGDVNSNRAFFVEDYKEYLFNRYLEDTFKQCKEKD